MFQVCVQVILGIFRKNHGLAPRRIRHDKKVKKKEREKGGGREKEMSTRISATARNMARRRAIQSDIVHVRSISRCTTINDTPMEGWMANLKPSARTPTFRVNRVQLCLLHLYMYIYIYFYVTYYAELKLLNRMWSIPVVRRFDCPVNRYSSDELISIRCRMTESSDVMGKCALIS